MSPARRIAVRPSEEREVDDVVVGGVSLFRLEQMDRNYWFACCLLQGESPDNRIAFDIRYDPEQDDVLVRVTEWPTDVTYEEGAGPP